MFDSQVISSSNYIRQFRISKNEKQLLYDEILNLWQSSEDFRSFFISILAKAPFSAYRWETPPITTTTINRVFEFVLLDSPSLARSPDEKAFASHFDNTSDGITTFPNLGKDAFLVVPVPQGPPSAYGHLAAFIKEAPKLQNHALWKVVGQTVEKQLSSKPIWLSTAGGGVSWLHVRLDSRPKYYGFKPYTTFQAYK